ncbi:DUF1573 domain-containing protein [Planctomicrobium sp. SH668]|uniref:DUF1573 domain-containing protein n=1 Tax=Planctomicrobium sp. SH668 TaxID=3448126 RepID=UPI003F5AE699
MNSRLFTSIVAAIFTCVLVTDVSAQQGEENWATRMFSELRHDFGTVARGADTRAILKIQNIYEEDVTIDNVGTTCGCTAAKPNKTLLKTGEFADVEIVMNTVKFMRRKDSNVDVTLTFRGPQGISTKTVRVPITAYIRSDVVISPEPGNANFGVVELGQQAIRKLDVAYAGREDWGITNIRIPEGAPIQADLKEVFRGSGQVRYELTVVLTSDAKMGTIQDQIHLITNDANSAEVPVLVLGTVEPDIVFSPAGVYQLGQMKAGEVREFRVVLRGRRPFSIGKIEADHPDLMSVKSPGADAKTVHIVPFQVTAPSTPGEFTENLTFTIAGRPEPLVSSATGVVVP